MKLVCIGDSLTFGYGLHKADKWVTLLEERLNAADGESGERRKNVPASDAGQKADSATGTVSVYGAGTAGGLSDGSHRKTYWEIINAGINGDTSGGCLARLREDVISQKPDMVLIMAGGNDYIAGCGISAVKAGITAMTMQCAAAGIKVFVSSEIPTIPGDVSPEWRAVADFEEYNRKQKEILDWFPKYCRGFGYTYIDLFDKWTQMTGVSSFYYQDGIHPNRAGSEVFAEVFYQEFKKFNNL